MKHSWKRFVSVMLAVAMTFALAVPAFAANDGASSGKVRVTWEKIETDPAARSRMLNKQPVEEPAPLYADNETVRVSIVLEDEPTLQHGYSTENIAENSAAIAYRESLQNKQESVESVISREVLHGKQLDVVWNLTLAANIISANVQYGQIEAIKAIRGVKDVFVETQYLPDVYSVGGDNPNNGTATTQTNTNLVWAAGYTGAGSKIAIVDTGLDLEHKSVDGDAFQYAIDQLEDGVELMDADDVAGYWDQLNASKFIPSVDGVYRNAKVPFAVNYVDRDLDAIHLNDAQGEHGSHVAGIAAANRYVDNGDGTFTEALTAVGTQGQAPDAQLLVMKVFGKGGGAYDSDYMAAIEDAIVMGCDSVNLSLGSSVAGFTTSNEYQDILNSLAESSIVWANSAGNNSFWAEQTFYGGLYGDNANFHTGGSPGTYDNSLAVASVDNSGTTGMPIVVDGNNVFYAETSGYGNEPISSIAGEHEFIFINGPGVDDNGHVGQEGDQFLAVGSENVSGKIAMCYRGTSSFFAKANAAVAQGAIGVIIVNNQPGTINMNLTGYNYTAPAVSITQADGEYFKTNESTINDVTVYTGTLTISDSISSSMNDSEYYTMSSFSSWGGNGALTMKPEITAPGGNIYSIWGANKAASSPTDAHDLYELMSGTSMASPQIAGIVAVLSEYIRENNLTAKTGLTQRQLIHSLLMSTAQPLIEEESGSYYSILNQGAGMVDVNAAANAKSYIWVTDVNGEAPAYAADGKVKVELGDDPDREGKNSFTFTINNFADETAYYTLFADFFTQDIVDGGGVTFRDTWTTPVSAKVTFTVDGQVMEFGGEETELDFNGDGVFNEDDAVAILEYVVNGTELVDDTGADMNSDGKIDTYDAYLVLRYFSTGKVIVPAGESVEVKVDVELNLPEELDENGNYVEGYVFVGSDSDDEGTIGETHSIPVYGYYGNWSEFSMFDVGSYLEYNAGLETRPPYLYSVLRTLNVQGIVFTPNGSTGKYFAGGNPVVADDGYYPERNAMNPNDVISGAQYTQVRNSAGWRFLINDGNGNPLGEMGTLANDYAAYYYPNGGEWRYTTSSTSANISLAGLEDGTQLELVFQKAPEYYLKDGAIDWDSVSDATAFKLPFTIDGTEPVIKSADSNEDDTALVVEASDNLYLAGIMVFNEEGWLSDGDPLFTQGAGAEAEPGASVTYEIPLDLTAEENQHLMVLVGDYASNVATYKINLNEEEVENPEIEVTLSEEEAVVVNTSSIQLTATVSPWGVDESVVWTSSNKEAATVNADGIVTGTGKGGTTVITATSTADRTKSASCTVENVIINKDLNGIVWDENGNVWFSAFDVATLPEYEKLNDASMRLALSSAFYDENGTMYVIDFDSDTFRSNVYTLDEDTYELTQIGGSAELGYMDACQAPSLGRDHFLAVYGPYVVIASKTTGEYEGLFDLSSFTGGNYLVGIAYEEQYNHPAYGNTDWVWLLDQAGNVYSTGFLPYGDGYSRFAVSKVGNMGDPVDIPYWQSLYYDGVSLYWSRFNDADNRVEIMTCLDVYNDGTVVSMGCFADGVWPVGGLYEKDYNPYFGPLSSSGADHSDAVLDENAVFSTKVEPIQVKSSAPVGGLNASNSGSTARPNRLVFDRDALTITVKADQKDTYNGLINVEYDKDSLKLVDVTTPVEEYNVINKDEEGKVVFGFATLNTINKNDVVLELQFEKIGDGRGEVNITTSETADSNGKEAKPNTSTVYLLDPKTSGSSGGGSTTPSEPTPVNPDPVNPDPVNPDPVNPDPVNPDPVNPEEKPFPFEDVPQVDGNWAYEAIKAAWKAGLMNGKGETVFAPNDPLTRGEVVTILYRLAGKPEVTEKAPFTDLVPGAYYEAAVNWAYANEVVKGMGDGTTFAPNIQITREQFATMIYRYAQLQGKGFVGMWAFPLDYADADQVADYAYEGMCWCVMNGIINGNGTGLNPKGLTSRAEAAAIISRTATALAE